MSKYTDSKRTPLSGDKFRRSSREAATERRAARNVRWAIKAQADANMRELIAGGAR